MSTEQFPPNSEASKNPRSARKNVTPVAQGKNIKRRQSLRKQFSGAFFSGDFRGAAAYAVLDVALPYTRDLVAETFIGAIEQLIFGGSRRRGATPPRSGSDGFVPYNRYSQGSRNQNQPPQRSISHRARSRHDFDEIILDNRAEAEMVLEQLYELVSKHNEATVADLYDLVGLASTHADNSYGWTDLSGSSIERYRGSYLLDLPEPEALD